MGANSSKSSGSQPPHVWKGSAPTSVSQDMLDSLQSSTETDASRAQTLELQIQARVAEELKRLQAKEDAKLKEAEEKLSELTDKDEKDSPSRQTVSKEVEALRAKLEGRKKVRELPDTVESARSEVIRCLRENDRRPLDCWKEVEKFKDEVRRLEKGWVDKVVS
ncbi:putative duf1690 domain-containing protein [Phaeoacremonium minimum UCRPA7]|uniref:Putative duf1690 domain-containing protein n=1 Tax=Phaeoacremonium minimum (strain UCR-PA7) TaxID=1286976 RepID=R8BIC5_PHAM7|nr:putative duf1690 domain-containing protein [Phaeoacremonium minimum UCRPA7]EON98992.1 putative duf1690 domain-containing protein [Phaeoacremonium minimum UCRPA7]